MNIKKRTVRFKSPLYFLALLAVVAVLYAGAALFSTPPVAQAQTDPFLERRISQIEQRFNFFETRISRLEQESRIPLSTPGIAANDAETRALRSEVEILRLRVAELECAAARLDERTLTDADRRARRQNAAETDPCRLTPNRPLNLSARP